MSRPSREDAEKAVKTLISWCGDDPHREGLLDTPSRVVRAFSEHFVGYEQNPADILGRVFSETENYDEVIMLRDIHFHSFCEHHIAPFTGTAHVAYKPNKCVVGISKIARLVDIFAKRLQIQERLTSQIANSIDEHLKPMGCLVVIEANHHCMTTRGVNKAGMSMVTTKATGLFQEDDSLRQSILSLIMNR
jgi:GTP cyclohydrolase I